MQMERPRVVSHHFGNALEPIGLISEAVWKECRPRWRQVHGVAVAEVSEARQDLGEVDAIWTRVPDLPIAVVTADCVPVLLEHREGTAVAALHAGWRGTEAKIIDVFFQNLACDPAILLELSHPKNWVARIGPSIRSCCYSVGEDLLERFESTFREIPRSVLEPLPGKLDLVAVLKSRLIGLGVEIASIHPDCTFCTRIDAVPKYFSYRRGDRDSRQYSMISIQSKK